MRFRRYIKQQLPQLRRMKILLIANSFTKNMKEATNITTLNYARELQRRGHQVIVVAEKRKYLPAFEVFADVPIYRHPVSFSNTFMKKIAGIQLTLRQLKLNHFYPDLIHVFSSSLFLSLHGILAKTIFPDSKIVHTIKSESQYQYDKRFTFLLRFVDLITVATKKQANGFIRKGIKKEKIRIIPSHINLAKFRPLPEENLKRKYGFSKREVVLNYGAMREDKGTADLFKSIPLVVKEKPSVLYLFICRWKKIEECYLRFIKDHKLEKNVKIITDDVAIEEYVNLADLAVFPYQTLTRTESNPSCVLECLACRTPVITTNLDELQEILAPEQDCIMVPPKNNLQIAAATIKLLNHARKRKKLAENGLKTARIFDLRKITQKFLREYETLLRK